MWRGGGGLGLRLARQASATVTGNLNSFTERGWGGKHTENKKTGGSPREGRRGRRREGKRGPVPVIDFLEKERHGAFQVSHFDLSMALVEVRAPSIQWGPQLLLLVMAQPRGVGQEIPSP